MVNFSAFKVNNRKNEIRKFATSKENSAIL